MYVSVPVIVILSIVIVWMANELRVRNKRLRLILWDVSMLKNLLGGQWRLRLYASISEKIVDTNRLGEVYGMPGSVPRLIERLDRYESHESNLDWPLRTDEMNAEFYYAEESVYVNSIIKDQNLWAVGYKELAEYESKTKSSRYKELYDDLIDEKESGY